MKKNKQKNRRLKRYIRKQINKKFVLNSRPNIDFPYHPPHLPGKLLLEE